jgi:hypothetical protein
MMRLEVVQQGFVDLVKRSKTFDFHSNFLAFYLFTKSTDPCQTTSKRINKASNHLPLFHLAPKHQKPRDSNWSKINQIKEKPTPKTPYQILMNHRHMKHRIPIRVLRIWISSLRS